VRKAFTGVRAAEWPPKPEASAVVVKWGREVTEGTVEGSLCS
jgi:hypothetical protein